MYHLQGLQIYSSYICIIYLCSLKPIYKKGVTLFIIALATLIGYGKPCIFAR